MATYTRLDLAGARAIGREFGIEVSRLTPIAAGSVNSSYRRDTATGRSVVARIYEEQGRREAG